MWTYDSELGLFLFVSAATHGLVLVLFRCLERYNSASVRAILDGLFSLPLFTALFTMCDWVEVLGGVGTTKKWRGVLFFVLLLLACSLLTDFPLGLLVFSHSLYYTCFVMSYWAGFQKLNTCTTFGWKRRDTSMLY